jgi:hypothetical protein
MKDLLRNIAFAFVTGCNGGEEDSAPSVELEWLDSIGMASASCDLIVRLVDYEPRVLLYLETTERGRVETATSTGQSLQETLDLGPTGDAWGVLIEGENVSIETDPGLECEDRCRRLEMSAGEAELLVLFPEWEGQLSEEPFVQLELIDLKFKDPDSGMLYSIERISTDAMKVDDCSG